MSSHSHNPCGRVAVMLLAIIAVLCSVGTYAREFLRGLFDARVLGCGKHFPGLGEANLDTHHALPSVEKPLKKLWEQDLVPYRTMRRELPFVMVSHAALDRKSTR